MLPAVTTAIQGVRVWDGSADAPSEPLHVRIEGDRIAGIGSDPGLLRDAEVLEAPPGSTVLPGLIDAHVHITLDPGLTTIEEQERLAPEAREQGMRDRALAMVRAGITSARDLGGGAWLELELRDQIARGELAGPRLICAGQPITSPGGHCHFWGGEARGPEAVREVVRRQLDHGVDWVKVMATGGVNTKNTRVDQAQLEPDELAALVDEASRGGRSVAAHCHGTQGIRLATAAHVRTIEHCSWAGEKGFGSDFDPALPPVIAAQDTWVSPTVNSGWTRFIERDGKETRFFADMQRAFEGLKEAGARIIASTDAGIPRVEHHHLPRALQIFARYTQFRPVEVLRAATSESAEALRIGDGVGHVREGGAADLLVVDGDPTEDLSALERSRWVFARGRFYEASGLDATSS